MNEIKRALQHRNESAGCLSTAECTLLSPGPEQHAHAHDLDTFRVQTAQGLLTGSRPLDQGASPGRHGAAHEAGWIMPPKNASAELEHAFQEPLHEPRIRTGALEGLPDGSRWRHDVPLLTTQSGFWQAPVKVCQPSHISAGNRQGRIMID